MKKRLIGTLLMGALLVSSTSVFVSCKDYDDDINSLSTRTTALEAAKAELEKEISDLKAELAAVKAEYATKGELADEKARAEAAEAALSQRITTAQEALDHLKALIGGELTGDLAGLSYQEALLKTWAEIKSVNALLGESLTEMNAMLNLDNPQSRLAVALKNLENQLAVLNAVTADFKEGDKAATVAYAEKLLEDAKGYTDTEVKKLDEDLKKLSDMIDALQEELNVLTIAAKHELKSIVLIPSYYIDGIEAISVPALKNYQLWVKGTNNEYTPSSTSKLNVSLSGAATYHLNPSSANILGYNISFFGNKATAIPRNTTTRSGENYVTPDSASITEDYLKNTKLYKKGELVVGFKADVTKISALKADELPMVALELTKGDTVVTSDFALVEPLEYFNFVLADKEYLKANKDKSTDHIDDYEQNAYADINNEHLHTNWRELVSISGNGIESTEPEKWAATVEIPYYKDTDLGARVETHHDMVDIKGAVTADKTLSDADFAALGLVYKYETVDYYVGANKTYESAHISVDENGVVTPHAVTTDGKPGENYNRATIGKLPIVRVRLEDSKGNVLAIGYYKLKIVDKDPDSPETPKEGAPLDIPVDRDFYANCQTSDWIEETLTWSKFEALVYAQLNLSKDEFEKTYEIQPAKGTQDADQYTYEVKNGENVYTKITDPSKKIGKVAEVADADNPTTNTLKWTVNNSYRDWQTYWSENDFVYIKDANGNVTAKVKKTSTEVVVCYKNKENDKSLYVRFTIPAQKIHFAAAKVNSTKVLGLWYQKFSPVQAEKDADAYEVGTGVKTISTAQNQNQLSANEFDVDLHQVYMSESYALLDASGKFNAFANKTMSFELTLPLEKDGNATAANQAKNDGSWEWKGLTNTYTLKLNGTKDAIQAAKKGTSTYQDIIRLDKNTGVITYLQNDFADDLLNGYSSNGRDSRECGERQTITAFVKIVVEDGCYPLDLVGTEFLNIRFFRPLNLQSVVGKEISDATNDAQYIDLSSLVKVIDWRDYTCGASNSDASNTIKSSFYSMEIGSVRADIMTDLHLGAADRKAVANAVPANGSITKAELEKLGAKSITEVPSLKDQNNLDIVNSTTKLSDPNGTTLKYQYTSSVSGDFHLYVPVYLKYVHAQNKDAWQHGYAVITVTKTQGSQARQK